MNTFLKSIITFLIVTSTYSAFSQATEAWYIRRTPPEPWTWVPILYTNIAEMDNVFGVGGWNSGYFTTVDVTDAFGPDSKFVFLEGGDDHAIDLKNFLVANLPAIEAWVYDGGSLLLNAAPNEGSDINFGFDGTLLDYTPGYYASNVEASIPAHPIFIGPYTPVGTSWTGTSYTHAKVTGTCLTTLIEESFAGYIACAEKHWGAGLVLFGGMTVTGWHAPLPAAQNLRQNMYVYLYEHVGVNAGSFTYPDSIYCQSDPDPFPVFDVGADTGIFVATPAGMVIDSATGQIDLTASTPGTYIITNGAIVDCVPSSFTMIIAADPKAAFYFPDDPFCSDEPDPAPFFILGGVAGTFTSSPAGMVINPLTGIIDLDASIPGTYSITNTVTSAYCGLDVVTIVVDIHPAYDILVDVAICNDEVYILPDGTAVFATGVYINNFITSFGCDSIITTSLLVSPTYTSTITAGICSGDIYILPDGTTTGIEGVYSLNFPTAFGCDSIIITNLTVDDVYNITENKGICTGETYTLPDGTITGITGTYISNLISASGCDSIITTHLMVFPTYAVPVTATICSGDMYILPDGSTTGVAGVYTTNLLSFYDCDSIITTTLTVDPVYFPIINEEICAGSTYTLPDGGIVSTGGTYISSYTTVAGCDSVITTNLIVNPNPVIIFDEDDVVCIENGSVLLNAYPSGGIYAGTGIIGGNFDPVIAGVGGPFDINYTYTDANGCTSSLNTFISVDQNFADAWGDTTIFAGEPANLYSEAGGDYLWTPPTQVICTTCPSTNAYPLESITYTIISVNSNGCIANDYMIVEVLPNPGNVVFIPNTFTPNGDNLNDYFFAYGYNLSTIKSFRVFDRWGSMIYIGEYLIEGNETAGWDGTYNGKELNQGVYAYIMELIFENGITTTYSGNVTLIK